MCEYLEHNEAETYMAHPGLLHRRVYVDGTLIPRVSTKRLRRDIKLRFGIQGVSELLASTFTTHPATSHRITRSHPASGLRWSARTVPAGCGSVDLNAQNCVAIAADAVGMVSG